MLKQITHRTEEAQRLNKELIRRLEKERREHFSGKDESYNVWQEEMKDIVSSLKKYDVTGVRGSSIHLDNGEWIDHHIVGYYAPVDFCGTGYNGRKLSAVEQIVETADQFTRHGIRFIYAPLPCKLAVYPEYALDKAIIPRDEIITPQWRKMIYDIACKGVETVDLFPVLRENKKASKLFSDRHSLSPGGCEIVGKEIAEYLKETTFFDDSCTGLQLQLEYAKNNNGESCILLRNNGKTVPYLGKEISSDIAIFGDCNLQANRGISCDVTSFLAYYTEYPVNYVGRLLPFCAVDSICKARPKTFKKGGIAIYLGFPSAAYVRPIAEQKEVWCTKEITEQAFY